MKMGFKIACTASLGLCLIAVGGCQTVIAPTLGIFITDVSYPIHAGSKVGQKEGRACAKSILGFVATGDASIKAAAAAGGITKIDSVDAEVKHMFYQGTFCTIVRGS